MVEEGLSYREQVKKRKERLQQNAQEAERLRQERERQENSWRGWTSRNPQKGSKDYTRRG